MYSYIEKSANVKRLDKTRPNYAMFVNINERMACDCIKYNTNAVHSNT
jgi:hypothetical protein